MREESLEADCIFSFFLFFLEERDDSCDRCNLPAIQSNTPSASQAQSDTAGFLIHHRCKTERNRHSSQCRCAVFHCRLMQTSACLTHTLASHILWIVAWGGGRKSVIFILCRLPSSLVLNAGDYQLVQQCESFCAGWKSNYLSIYLNLSVTVTECTAVAMFPQDLMQKKRQHACVNAGYVPVWVQYSPAWKKNTKDWQQLI